MPPAQQFSRPTGRPGPNNIPQAPQTPNQGPRPGPGPYPNRPSGQNQQRPPTNQAAGGRRVTTIRRTRARPARRARRPFFSAKAVSQLRTQGPSQAPKTRRCPCLKGRWPSTPRPRARRFARRPASTTRRPSPSRGTGSTSRPPRRSNRAAGRRGRTRTTGRRPLGAVAAAATVTATATATSFRPAPRRVVRPPRSLGVGRSGMGGAQFDHARRIGAPGAAGSPLANRNSYRPPTMKRPLPGEVVAGAGSGMGGGSGPDGRLWRMFQLMGRLVAVPTELFRTLNGRR